MEQIRIIKEMRKRDVESGRTGNEVRPRFMVFENVAGLFSVNGGRDFAAVLEEIVRVSEPDAPDIHVPKGGWTNSGCIMGRQWSVAWRVLDAQFWGVPQRRRRIALVADFSDRCAPEVLFERRRSEGHFESGETQGQRAAGDASDRSGTTSDGSGDPDRGVGRGYMNISDSTICVEGNGYRDSHRGDGYSETDTMYTLNTVEQHAVAYSIPAFNSKGMLDDNTNADYRITDVARTLTSRQDGSPCADRGPDVVVFESHDQDARYRDLGEISETVSAKYGTGGGNQPIVVSIGNGQADAASHVHEEIAGTLNCMHDQQAICVSVGFNAGQYEDDEVYGLDRAAYNQVKNALFDFSIESEKIGCQTAKGPGAVCSHYIVRRLTPLECERLQGLPDKWTDIGDWVDDKGKTHKCSDAARYKAIGNGIAVPPWLWVLSRLNQFCEDKTMASLFDGVGTFPMIWSFLNGKENCVWSSEIEPFPIAVSKYHFQDEDDTD